MPYTIWKKWYKSYRILISRPVFGQCGVRGLTWTNGCLSLQSYHRHRRTLAVDEHTEHINLLHWKNTQDMENGRLFLHKPTVSDKTYLRS